MADPDEERDRKHPHIKVKLEDDEPFVAPLSAASATSCAEVEVLEHIPPSVASVAPHPTADDDVAVVGTLNQVNLPHMRKHCTEQPFQSNTGTR